MESICKFDGSLFTSIGCTDEKTLHAWTRFQELIVGVLPES